MHVGVPFLGNLVLCLVLVSSAYVVATALAAARGRPRFLDAARFGTYATCALVALAVCLLAYAFQTHDFRIRYVARYSDRSMSPGYLVTALWGGQDGSLLWWSFLLSGYTAVCTASMRNRYHALQPWVLATLASIFMFFVTTMLFAANPFATGVGAPPPDGEGLNPLLQNYWMAIHPPTLYLGFVGWSVPFAFAMAALATGRLSDEWTQAARRWALVAWLFLSIGLTLGMLWSYEELGWGGYWAWDPVENASFMPWLIGTAYLHSVLVQERLQMLRVWTIALLCGTFFMTIFGTFLTRSGLIASVHSFARSDIGVYFAWYLLVLALVIVGAMTYRLPELRRGRPFTTTSAVLGFWVGGLVGLMLVGWGRLVEAVHPRRRLFSQGEPTRIVSMVSREFALLFNNWILVGMMFFVLGATTFPLISDWLRGEEVTVGPPYYNQWMVPFGLVLLCLLGVGPLISWRKATGKNLLSAFALPVAFGFLVAVLHLVVGPRVGFPAFVEGTSIYETVTGEVLRRIYSASPWVSFSLAAFVLATIYQEFHRGTRARMRARGEGAGTALVQLIGRARRRYGGYIVHVGIVLMYVGFTGAAYDIEEETVLHPGDTFEVGRHEVRYEQPRMEVDPNKRMLFADFSLLRDDGTVATRLSPAKFIYSKRPDMPTTEVAIRTSPLDDLYLIVSTVDPTTKRGVFRLIVRPLVMWIWIGGLVLVLGTAIAMFPSAKELLGGSSRRPTRLAATAAAMLLMGVVGLDLVVPTLAAAQDSSSLHAGTVIIDDPEEKRLFARLLCQCGSCARLPLDSCICSWAEEHRAELRDKLERGASVDALIRSYRAEFGPKAISIPTDAGLDRALWAVPLGGIALGIGGLFVVGRRWKQKVTDVTSGGGGATGTAADAVRADYDAKLDEELRRLEGE